MNRDVIIANLRGIWEALVLGDPIESRCGNFIFFCLKELEKYWYGIDFEKAQPHHPKVDQIEVFLSNIADL